MNTYLLDTNHVIPLLRSNDPRRANVQSKLAGLPPATSVCISTVTLSELELGFACQTAGRVQSQAELRAVIAQNRLYVKPFTNHTAAEYGAVKAALMARYNRLGKEKAAKWPERWEKPTTGEKLGADELDVMLVSHAIERNMVLVTGDAMNRLFDALEPAGIKVQRDNWLRL